MFIWYTNYHLGGSFLALGKELVAEPLACLQRCLPSCIDSEAWALILGFAAFELALMRLVPGKEFKGHLTPAGNIPVYTANGMACWLLTLAAFAAGTYFGLFQPSRVYDKFGEIISGLNAFSLAFCAFLVIKGYYFPSTSDNGKNSNIVLDYYWGVELYPRIFGVDVKTFTNCRFGMMYWTVGPLCYAVKQFEDIGYLSDSMSVCIALQLIYVAKFFWWETGYWCSMDIQHDRAGFYLCWGCLVFLPSLYTSQSYYLTKHPVNLGPGIAAAIFLVGLYCIFSNYDADRQRQNFRETNGKCRIWGKEPDYVVAEYTTENGITKHSLLLASGYWGVARHFHYVFEIGAAFCWSVPALFQNYMPYLYVSFLTVLLFDRAFRDNARCKAKYGKYWDEYCAKVPYKIIPGII
eukprot:NODE_6219_length_1692_cov_8.598722.p1 GENE.NODE_6219_length_1692_cov_8.598722~~NODE_6219_length_1692_cov_8.598722.p1  ORF type:complete len:441 (-),score=121.92 NODE_6219_length_1692_cov_8.598722:369-1589(-)